MNKVTIIFIYIILIFNFFACSSSIEDKKSNHKTNKKARLVITDSIVFAIDTLHFKNYLVNPLYPNLFIIKDQNNEVRLFEGVNFVAKIGQLGKGPGEYTRVVASRLYNKDSIFIADHTSGKVLLFSSKGLFLKSWEVTRFDTYNTFTSFNGYLNVFSKNKEKFIFEYLGSSTKKNMLTQPNYYKNAKVFSEYSTETKKVMNYIPFGKESPYQKNEYFLSPLDPCIDILPNGFYSVIFPHEDAIYLYNKEKEIYKIIEGNSEKFPKPKGVSFQQADKNFGVDYVKYNVKTNALNYPTAKSFNENGKIILLKQYEAPVQDDRLPNDFNTLRTMYYKRDSYLQLYDINGNKLYQDIIQPKEIRNLVYIKNMNYLLFQSHSKLTDKNILYVAKIIEE